MHNVQNALFAAGLAFSLGKSLEDIRHGLRTFDSSYFQAPGRMNVFNEHPFKVILDYGHNPAAIDAMCRLVQQLAPKGKRICVFTLPGDRRDEDMAEAARIVAGGFDRYICRRDDNLRGRGADEVPQLLRDGLIANGVASDAISMIPEEEKAVTAALEMAEPEDLVLIFGDSIARTWKQIVYFNREEEARAAEEEPAEAKITVAQLHSEPAQPSQPVADAPEVPETVTADGLQLVRDERGVRLAREPELED